MKLIDSSKIVNITCDKVSQEEADNIMNNTAKKMYELIKNERKAVAIAAPQVGIFKRFFVYNTKYGYIVVFNPVYSKDGSIIKSRESCLSYGLDNFAIVKRFKTIKLKYDEVHDGKFVSTLKTIKYPLSVIVQHETDHLNGRTIFNQ